MWLTRIVAALFLTAAGIAALLVAAQQPFDNATFEFGIEKEFAGTLYTRPTPWILRPDGRPLLLVAPGKHGIGAIGATGDHLQLRGSLIHRDNLEMLEVLPASVRKVFTESADLPLRELGVRTLRGEIVDSKCYLGVMNPGRGHVHRDCAARCLAGGVPPAFLTNGQVLLLENLDVRAMLPKVGLPITLTGRLYQLGALTVFALQ